MTTYSEVPYPELSHVQTHPDNLATLARLLGLKPAPANRCRVLEIGCAAGGNVIPMALGLPDSEFVGIDYAPNQIARGQELARQVGVNNLRLLAVDIVDITAELGEFDYIIAHGVYSWVPPEVRDRLLAVCRQNLAPNGIAYVSYNTYPGWHLFGMLRDMMLYHVRDVEDPATRAAGARDLLNMLTDIVPSGDAVRGGLLVAYGNYLQEELKRVGAKADAYLLHDELEEVNDPVYFYQFMEHAERHGLQFVTEVDFRRALPTAYPPKVSEALFKRASSIVELEQYLDFVRTRTFRQTLLCHQNVTLNRKLTPESLQGFLVAARAVPESAAPDLLGQTVEKFKGLDGATLSIDHPVSKAAMVHLALEWPRAVPYESILPAAVARLKAKANGAGAVEATPRDEQVLAANLLKAFAYSEDLVELHTFVPHFTLEVSERPLASPWARWQAQEGTKVTNLRHERVDLNPLQQFVLRYVDGTRDTQALVDVLLDGPVANGTLQVQHEGQPVRDPAQVRAMLAEEVATCMRWLARAALLMA